MFSTRFLQCWVPLLLLMQSFFFSNATSVSAIGSGGLAEQEKLLHSEMDKLQRQIDEIGKQIEWLQKEKDFCDQSLRRIKQDLDSLS